MGLSGSAKMVRCWKGVRSCGRDEDEYAADGALRNNAGQSGDGGKRGTFGYGREFAELYDINCLGGFSFKGTTLEPRFGNPTPRIAECEAGLINSIGLQNPGVEKVIEEELPQSGDDF